MRGAPIARNMDYVQREGVLRDHFSLAMLLAKDFKVLHKPLGAVSDNGLRRQGTVVGSSCAVASANKACAVRVPVPLAQAAA